MDKNRLTSINIKKTAVIVVDMQNDFVAEGAPLYSDMGNKMMPRMVDFLDACRNKGMMIIYTEHVFRKDGVDLGQFARMWPNLIGVTALLDDSRGGRVHDMVAPKEGDVVIKKRGYSAFPDTELETILKTCGIDTVCITGVATDFCCFGTARDAMTLNYNVAFLSDLTGTFDIPDLGYGSIGAEAQHQVTLANIAMSTGDVMTSEKFLELTEK